ncbi:glycosyltransferase [Caldithrix abyssi]
MQAISVIISVYNRLDYLKKALISIQHQSVLPSEVIITDDGSQEPIVDVVQELVPQFDFRIKLVIQEDRGFRLARCKNNGIRVAENDFLVFWDQDVVGTRRYLETYYENWKPGMFVVSYPVRLSEAQTQRLTEADIRQGDYSHILNKEQLKKIRKQFKKDRFYFYLRKFILRNDTRPKLRGGIFAISRAALLKVNGFDERYQGWGNEDDDLGRRLYASGVVGFNPFYDQFPLHLYHPPYHTNGQRANQKYYLKRQQEIKAGHYRAEYGLDKTFGEDDIKVLEF